MRLGATFLNEQSIAWRDGAVTVEIKTHKTDVMQKDGGEERLEEYVYRFCMCYCLHCLHLFPTHLMVSGTDVGYSSCLFFVIFQY